MKFLTILIGLFVLGSCSKKTIGLNDEFSLKYGKSALIQISDNEKIDLNYLDVSEESRCAPGMQCFWAGSVAIVLKLDDQYLDTLGLNSSSHLSKTEYKGKIIQLLEVSYGSDKNFGKKSKSSIRLIIE